MKRFSKSLWIVTAVAAAALTGCGSTAGSGGAAAPAANPAASSAAVTAASGSSGPAAETSKLALATSTLGQIIVDGAGRTVYVFDKDVADSGKSNCSAGCLASWPPVIAKSGAPAATGISAKIGTITTADGAKQVTVNGLPVYYFAADRAAGDTKGQGVNSIWWVLDPAGTRIGNTTDTSGY
jgi:predicted lipoprotein with Yx(FWY)xxD motif